MGWLLSLAAQWRGITSNVENVKGVFRPASTCRRALVGRHSRTSGGDHQIFLPYPLWLAARMDPKTSSAMFKIRPDQNVLWRIIMSKRTYLMCVVSLSAAMSVIAAPTSAKTVWEQLNDTAPWSQPRSEPTATRSLFDDISDAAPVCAHGRELVGE
jgi:hypothetical protein